MYGMKKEKQEKKQPKPKEPEALCDKRCESCIYHINLPTFPDTVGCYYLVQTYKRRPCPPGKECTVYIKGKPPKENKVALVATKKRLIHCEVCGREVWGMGRIRYCADCAAIKCKENKAKFYAGEKADRHARLINTERYCKCCGKPYHSEKSSVRYCAECDKLTKYEKKKRSTEREKINANK